MKFLLTGATGLLGSNILEAGIGLGHSFKAISRRVPKRSFLFNNSKALGIEAVSVDLLDSGHLPLDLFDEIDCVINCAGLASIKKEDGQRMESLNVGAAQNLFKAAKEAGVKKWVQVSSIATMCSGISKEPVSETSLGHFRPTVYASTKHQIDLWLEANRDDVELLTVHPCYMLGKWDSRPSSGSLLFALKMKRVPALIDSVKNFVSPRDVARGIFLALDSNQTGNFILGGENASLKDFINLCCQKLGLENRQQFVSHEDFGKLELKDMERAFAEEFSLASPVSNAKAKAAFGYASSVSLEQMVDEAIAYFAFRSAGSTLRGTGKGLH